MHNMSHLGMRKPLDFKHTPFKNVHLELDKSCDNNKLGTSSCARLTESQSELLSKKAMFYNTNCQFLSHHGSCFTAEVKRGISLH